MVGWCGKIKQTKKTQRGMEVESLMFGNHQANANFQGKGVVKKMKLFTFKSESLGKDWYDLKICGNTVCKQKYTKLDLG